MSTTPNPDYPNPKRLAGLMRSFDQVVSANYLQDEPRKLDPNELNVDLKALKAQCREEDERLEREGLAQVSPWYTFPLFKAIRRYRDNIRLRNYNRDWIKINIR